MQALTQAITSEIETEFQKAIVTTLSKEQLKRFQEINLQWRSPYIFLDGTIRARLRLSKLQIEDLTRIAADATAAHQKLGTEESL